MIDCLIVRVCVFDYVFVSLFVGVWVCYDADGMPEEKAQSERNM